MEDTQWKRSSDFVIGEMGAESRHAKPILETIMSGQDLQNQKVKEVPMAQ